MVVSEGTEPVLQPKADLEQLPESLLSYLLEEHDDDDGGYILLYFLCAFLSLYGVFEQLVKQRRIIIPT
jgi:hypothetical protein